MKLASFYYCLAILIVTLANSKVRCFRINRSPARYTGPNEQNKITNSSSYSKISSTNLPLSDRKSYDNQTLVTNKQDPKLSNIKSSNTKSQTLTTTSQSLTTKSQNLQQLNDNVPTGRAIAEEHETSTHPNQNWRPSTSTKASSRASNAQTFKSTEQSKLGADYSSSIVTQRTDNRVRTTIPTNFRAESTILITEKWASTPSTIPTSTKSNLRLTTKSMSARPFVSSSTDKSSSTTERLSYGSTADSSTTRADQSKGNNDAIVFPAASTAPTTSKTPATQWPAISDKGNGTTVSANVNATGTIENKFIYDVPEFSCPEGEKRDADKKCRKVL